MAKQYKLRPGETEEQAAHRRFLAAERQRYKRHRDKQAEIEEQRRNIQSTPYLNPKTNPFSSLSVPNDLRPPRRTFDDIDSHGNTIASITSSTKATALSAPPAALVPLLTLGLSKPLKASKSKGKKKASPDKTGATRSDYLKSTSTALPSTTTSAQTVLPKEANYANSSSQFTNPAPLAQGNSAKSPPSDDDDDALFIPDESSYRFQAAPINNIVNMPPRRAPAATAAPALPESEIRYTERSTEYKKAYKSGFKDTKQFDTMVTLTGPNNYATWKRQLLNCALAMLEHAEWLARNLSLLSYIRRHITEGLQLKIEGITLVATALEAIKNHYMANGVYYFVSRLGDVSNYSFNEAGSFEDFIKEFERRITELHALAEAPKLPDDFKTGFFVKALGPRFSNWIMTQSLIYKICGIGKGKQPISYESLKSSAGNEWERMS
ncbi:unnamed protein product [Zymoseptoria tritici ST99CH_1E4]|uniref:Uncharacterized protein n=1 Tax=Zymoseptoria tritici ST99CH_1E4 TaxID=1276532 RepID=A0A2H1FWG1_ZYMTR|nr:unnamed protein product [Zymoseptoria tritici ST99CH_1E4]